VAVTFPERVAARAPSVNVIRLLLSVLAFPFYVLGVVVGLLFVSVQWAYSAVVVGFEDVRRRRGGG
jgi:hypothetical protein